VKGIEDRAAAELDAVTFRELCACERATETGAPEGAAAALAGERTAPRSASGA
jgi:hypothetical protein